MSRVTFIHVALWERIDLLTVLLNSAHPHTKGHKPHYNDIHYQLCNSSLPLAYADTFAIRQ